MEENSETDSKSPKTGGDGTKLGKEGYVLIIVTTVLCGLYLLAVAINAPGDDPLVKFVLGIICAIAALLALASIASNKAVKLLRWFYVGLVALYVIIGAIAEKFYQQ